MAERVVLGLPASPGLAAGAARRLDPSPGDAEAPPLEPAARADEAALASAALRGAAEEIDRLATRLRAEGRADDAEIVATGSLLAADPEIAEAVRTAVLDRGRSAAAAILEATGAAAAKLGTLEDQMLAARADDLTSLGRRAARIALGGRPEIAVEPRGEVVVVAQDLGPADIAELGAGVGAIALGRGAVTAHAAIVARSLGLPMVIGLGAEVDAVGQGEQVIVDGGEGTLVRWPDSARSTDAELARSMRAGARRRAVSAGSLPATTTDGTQIIVLTNVASATELGLALESGAEGIGLLRTELGFLDAAEWPREELHRRQLQPIMRRLGDRPATVRTLDFGGDKSPPFLKGTRARGLALMLEARENLAAQLRAIVDVGKTARLRVLLPMVNEAGEVDAARAELDAAARTVGAEPPPLGAMIETKEAVVNLAEIAARSDFLSVGTNDLTASILGRDRFAAGGLKSHDPRVLAAIASVIEAAGTAGLPVEVCGEMASDPITAPVLIGLGATELSVGAARVGAVRAWVRMMAMADVRRLAAAVLAAADTAAVEALAEPLARLLELAEIGDAGGEGVNGRGGVAPLRSQP